MSLDRPAENEFAEYYAKYVALATRQVESLEGGSIVDLLTVQPVTLHELLDGAPPEMAHHAYAPGKWTLAESLSHVADTERVFSYRLLRIARGDTIALPGFDHDVWVTESGANDRPLADILTELDVVRAATLSLVHSLTPASLLRIGTASNQPVSARALVWIAAGHFAHHLELTRDRYLADHAAT